MMCPEVAGKGFASTSGHCFVAFTVEIPHGGAYLFIGTLPRFPGNSVYRQLNYLI
jgi:hypothetical protein